MHLACHSNLQQVPAACHRLLPAPGSLEEWGKSGSSFRPHAHAQKWFLGWLAAVLEYDRLDTEQHSSPTSQTASNFGECLLRLNPLVTSLSEVIVVELQWRLYCNS